MGLLFNLVTYLFVVVAYFSIQISEIANDQESEKKIKYKLRKLKLLGIWLMSFGEI